MATELDNLIAMLYDMIDSAKSMALDKSKCVISRDDALDLLDEIKGQLPVELKKAQNLINARDEYVEKAKKEAERLRRQAEIDARNLVSESEITRIAREKAREMLRHSTEQAGSMFSVANEYTDDALRRTEEAIQAALEEIRRSRAQFRAVSNEKLQPSRTKMAEQLGDDRRLP